MKNKPPFLPEGGCNQSRIVPIDSAGGRRADRKARRDAGFSFDARSCIFGKYDYLCNVLIVRCCFSTFV